MIVTVEFHGPLEGLSRKPDPIRFQLGNPEVVVNLGGFGNQANRLRKFDEGHLDIATVERGRSTSVETSTAPGTAAEEADDEDEHSEPVHHVLRMPHRRTPRVAGIRLVIGGVRLRARSMRPPA